VSRGGGDPLEVRCKACDRSKRAGVVKTAQRSVFHQAFQTESDSVIDAKEFYTLRENGTKWPSLSERLLDGGW
jgi:hypothetical protein